MPLVTNFDFKSNLKRYAEVASGDVVIKSVARVSGKMSKVAVARREGAEVGWHFSPR